MVIKEGITELVRLAECNDSVANHLSSCHLSREILTKNEIILARAGVFELSSAKVSDMSICPKKCHTLEKYWKQRKPCQYPTHRGGKKAIKSRDVLNVSMSKKIMKLHGVIIPQGGRSQNFSKGGHSVSHSGYSPHCYVENTLVRNKFKE